MQEHGLPKDASMFWTVPILLSLAILFRQTHNETYLQNLAHNSSPLSHQLTGEGCENYQELDMKPQNALVWSYLRKVVHCKEANAREGMIVLHTHKVLPRAVFRLRLVGPEVHLVRVQYHSDRVHFGQYKVTRPGNYSTEVMMLYSDFDKDFIQSSALLENQTFTSATSLFIMPSQLNTFSRDSCEAQGLEGTWTVKNDEIRAFLQTTRSYLQDPWPAKHPMIHDLLPTSNESGLHFESLCNPIVPKGLLDPAYINCVKQAKVCMWGDSQMRHLYNTIAEALFHSAGVIMNKKEVLDGHSSLTFTMKLYDNFGQDVEGLLRAGNCSVLIANFGQWPASWTEGYPWPLDKYKVYMEADMRYLKILEQKFEGIHTFWTTTNPHGYVRTMADGHEWRTDPVLDAYHKVTLQLASDHGVNLLDTYSIANPLRDLTYDGAHYKGIVGWTLASYVMQSICKL
jgi:hypothetical protein